MDKFSLMRRNGAEVTTAETAPVGVYGELYHVVCRNALAFVPGMRQLGERKVPETVHFLLSCRRIRRVNLHITFPYRLQDGIRMHHVGMGLNPVEILCKGNFVLLALFKTMKHQGPGGGRHPG